MTKILCVEDDPDLLELISYRFKSSDYEVLQARDGLEAIEILKHEKVDIILSDIRMPRCSGIQLLEHVQKMELQKKPIVILLTGYSDYNEQDIITRGGTALLLKPADILQIVENVEKFFKKSAVK